jgi:hypothetical protein
MNVIKREHFFDELEKDYSRREFAPNNNNHNKEKKKREDNSTYVVAYH